MTLPQRFHLLSALIVLLGALLVLPACGDDDDDDTSANDDDDGFHPVTFPDEFFWGTASAAYQAEGTDDPDLGTVSSNWQQWEEQNRIADQQRNPRGANFYQVYDEDFQLAADLGNNAYRLGLEWARIEPEQGEFNEAAIDHYRDVLIAARNRGLEPIVTLYHWVVPSWVQSPEDGTDILSQPLTSEEVDGQTVIRSPWGEAFLPYVRRMASEFGDLVDWWVVLNEPYSVLTLGYLTGNHPNGDLVQLLKMRNAALNYIVAYPMAYDAIKGFDNLDANGDGRTSMVGNASVGSAVIPKNPDDPEDVAGAEAIHYLVNEWMPAAWLDGDLDVNLDRDVDDLDGIVPEGNYYEQLGNRMDYIGFNYYSPVRVLGCPSLSNFIAGQGPEAVELADNIRALPQLAGEPGVPVSENGLEVNAEEFLTVMRFQNQFATAQGGDRPILILENGHGDCDDNQRAKFLTEHLYQVGLALEEGIPVEGYMLWSLTDNFEWHDGRHQCFGIYKVDYDNDFERIATRSVPLYKEIIETDTIDEALWEEYASGRYPTDCLAIEDADERQECIDALPPNPLEDLQLLVGGACGP